MRGRRTVPPSISGTPHRLQNTPSVASSSTTRRSASSANSNPPATAYPLTAAITGLDKGMRVGPIGPSPPPSVSRSLRREGSPTDVRSAPAQNVPPAPARTATLTSGSSSNR
ncbi:Uncharacterised protein [Mycobacteroides abscessus subsp. abscessus]|nr:Uncharacterised protein [Mycobacteroides abscessus subsp. abscessus]